jgi:uncharacterized membrane protein
MYWAVTLTPRPTLETCLDKTSAGSGYRTRKLSKGGRITQGLSSEECATNLSKRKAPLKASLLLLIFTLGSISVSGAILTLPISDAHKTTGSFVLTLSPTSISVPQGANGTTVVSIMSTQSFAGTVFLSAQANNSAVTVSFTPTSVSVTSGGTARSVASVQASKSATMGTYNVIITGTAASGKRIFSSSALLTFTVDSQADFAAYANPYAITVTAGFSNSTSVTLNSINGFSGSVSLYATTPFGFLGVMGGQNPLILTPGSTTSTSLQVSATTLTALGKYNITITGVSGSVAHSCILTVTVVDPVPESLTLAGFSLLSPTGISLSLHNNGNTPVTLTSYTVTDITTDSWTLGNWTGPTLAAGTTSQATILIGASCNACTYSGVPFAFQQFVTGHTYVISVTTKLDSQFTFTIVVA